MTQLLIDATNNINLSYAVGFKEIDGKLFHFEKNGYGSGINSWFNVSSNGHDAWYYCIEEGVVTTGFRTIGDERFYFAEKNNPATFSDGITRETGELVHNTWFHIPGGDHSGWYRADPDGLLNRGVLPWGAKDRYFFDKSSGKSLFSIRQSGEKMYGYKPGNVTVLLTGFHTDHEGHRYYFGVSGDGISSLAVSELAKGWFHIHNGPDAGWYYADNMGVLNTGEPLQEGDNRYFFDATGKSIFSVRLWSLGGYGFGPGPDVVKDKVHGLYQDGQGDHYYFHPEDGAAAYGKLIISPGKYYFDVLSKKSLGLYFYNLNGKCYIGDVNGNALAGKQTIAVLVYDMYTHQPLSKEISFDAAELEKVVPLIHSMGLILNCTIMFDDINLYMEQLFGFVIFAPSSSASYTAYYYDPKQPNAGVSEGRKAINQNITVDGIVYKVIDGKVQNYDGEGDSNSFRCFFEKGHFIEKANYWYQDDDGSYYHYNADFKHDTGWFDNGKYYLGAEIDNTGLNEGQLATNWRQINNKWYYFGDYHDDTGLSPGELAQGFHLIGNDVFYFAEKNSDSPSGRRTGEMLSGWQTISSEIHYFGSADDTDLDYGMMAMGFQTINHKIYYFTEPEYSLQTRGAQVKGWHKIQNDWYYFDNTGVMVTGWLTLGSKIYYLGKENDNSDVNLGVMSSGWFYLGDKTFYSGVSGDKTNLSEGQLATGQLTIDYRMYYFAEQAGVSSGVLKGEMAMGWQQRGEQHFYYGSVREPSNLKPGQMAIWWAIIDDKYHYFSGDGSAYAYGGNFWLKDYKVAGAPVTWYLLEKSALATGWQTIVGGRYYFGRAAKQSGGEQKEQTDGSGLSAGEIAIGFKRIDGNLYYFATGDCTNEDRLEFVRGEYLTDWFKVEGKWYLADYGDGIINTSERNGIYSHVDTNSEYNTYYADHETGASLFSITKEGKGMQPGPVSKGNVLVNTAMFDSYGLGHYFNGAGERFSGWYSAPEGRIYCGQAGNRDALSEYRLAIGFQEIDGNLYYFDNRGVLSTAGWFTVGDEWYRYNKTSGHLDRGCLMLDNNQDYYFDSLSGKFLYMFMTEADGSRTAYHYSQPGSYKKFTTPGWTADKQYYLNAGMKVVTGWQKIENKYYYFCTEKENYGKIKTGFRLIDGKQYYLGTIGDGTGLNEGQMARYSVLINDRRHYFDGQGVAWPDKSWLADYNKEPVQNTWYILEKGECAFGWESIDGHDYYFNPRNDYRLDR